MKQKYIMVMMTEEEIEEVQLALAELIVLKKRKSEEIVKYKDLISYLEWSKKSKK